MFSRIALRISSRVSAKKVLGLRQLRPIRLQMKLPAVRGDDASGRDHRRSVNIAALDGGANAHTRVPAFVADVADSREAVLEHRTCVDHALNGTIGVRIAEGCQEVVAGVAGHIDVHAQVGMGVEQAWHDRVRR
jgi:hypothetical protein